MSDCVFCSIVKGALPAHEVYRDESCVAFLDNLPLFPGHVLVIPARHHGTIADLPLDIMEPLFVLVKRVAAAVCEATGKPGSFIAMNNVVSQSVPHLHVHVVPRLRKDGLRGFFWPRTPYASEEEMTAIAAKIRSALQTGTGKAVGRHG